MRNRMAILAGIVVLVLGVFSLSYDAIVLEKRENKEAEIGPLKLHVEYPKQQRFRIPAAVSWGAIILGAGLAGGGLLASRPR